MLEVEGDVALWTAEGKDSGATFDQREITGRDKQNIISGKAVQHSYQSIRIH